MSLGRHDLEANHVESQVGFYLRATEPRQMR